MERRLLLVFALTFLAIMLFQPLLKKYMPQPPAKTESPQAAPVQPPAQPPMPAGKTASAAGAVGKNVPAATPQQAASESETVIENGLYRIVFTNRGAHVRSWVLKKYTDEQGKPLELVNSTAAAKYGYPLWLWSYDENLRNKLNSVLYVTSQTKHIGIEAPKVSVSPKEIELASNTTSAPAEITFTYADGDVSVQKTFKFDHSYVVEARTSVAVKGSEVPAFLMWPAGFGDQTNAPQYGYSQIVYQYNGNVERLAIKKISSGNTLPGPFYWAGTSDQYFAAVFLPQDPQNAAMVTLRNAIEIPHSTDRDNKQLDKVEVLGAAVGSLKGMMAARIYVGPKALPDLESVKVQGAGGTEADLRALIDFGSILGPIARALFLWLKWTTKYVPNWGWAIVIQTIIINLALLPLRLSQMKSMLKMQRVAPQIKAIQEKYKKYSLRDPKKAAMNEEISALYKKEGVNPVGGCLPLIIQMPFLFAYYRMLGVAIDLRHAPWLWVGDLSAPDPHYILPIAIVVTMFAMQRMTPQAGMDPTQQKMMNIMMPLVLGYVSFNLAAGLCLYWAMGQVIGIVQQMALNRSTLGREMREMMEKRARKKEK